MSLIQEALKRQHEDSGKVQPAVPASSLPKPPVGGPPPVPAPLASAPSAPPVVPELPVEETEPAVEEEAPRRQKSVLVGVLVGVLLLVTAAVFMGWFAMKRMRAAAQEHMTGVARELLTNAVVTAGTNRPAVVAAAAAPETRAAPAATNAVPAAAQAASVPAPATVAPGGTAVATLTSTVETATVEIPKPVIRWPTLTLKAVINRGQDKGVAVINGKSYEVGDEIDGVSVISFGNQCVHLQFKGEKRILRVGGTTQ